MRRRACADVLMLAVGIRAGGDRRQKMWPVRAGYAPMVRPQRTLPLVAVLRPSCPPGSHLDGMDECAWSTGRRRMLSATTDGRGGRQGIARYGGLWPTAGAGTSGRRCLWLFIVASGTGRVDRQRIASAVHSSDRASGGHRWAVEGRSWDMVRTVC